ncbi:MAG: hypothetical protein ACFCVK_06155 [Acidimicrobiales bacterium]
MSTVTDRRVATADPPPTGIANPIHDDEGADGAGYAGALVAGVRTYGWAAQTIARALGSVWLDTGWVDVSLRRPLFVGDDLSIVVAAASDGDGATWRIEATARTGDGEPRVVLDGTAGLGDAPWLGELDPPPVRPGQDPPTVRPTYDLASVPLGEPLRPLRAYVKADAARRIATDDLGIDDPRYLDPDQPAVHPYFLAGRMAPLTRHNFTYGPTIHVRSQIQHRGPALADQAITVGARIVDAYDRNGHWYQVLDGIVTGDGGAGAGGQRSTELARIRHHTIFRPRGTVMPEPIRLAV